MKRFTTMLLATCLLCAVLIACGEQRPAATTAAPTTAAPTTLPPTTEPPTTVPPTTEGPTKNGVPIDWIIEEDTSISGEITFAVPFKRELGMDAMVAAFNEIYPTLRLISIPIPMFLTARPHFAPSLWPERFRFG